MKRNIFETILAFVGLGMVYLGAGIDQCLHAQGQPAPNCHFTPLGNTLFTVGFVVGFIGIAPWKIYARNYVCQVCSAEFGGGKNGKLSRDSHYISDHPDFYNWDVRWIRWTDVLALSSFVYVIGGGQLVAAIPSLSAFTDWWVLGFVGVCLALVLDLVDMYFVTRKFKARWLLGHPEGRTLGAFQVEPEKLSAGVTAWRQFTRGQEQYFGGLMSGGLKKKGNFAGGYGVYFTSQRIIGVESSRWFIAVLVVAALAGIGGAAAITLLVGASGAVTYYIAVPIIVAIIAWGQGRLHFQDPLGLEELDRRKDVEIRRDEISGIDLRKPGLVRRGHLTVASKQGKNLEILITQEPGVFERLRGLVAGFSFVPKPEWIKDRPPPINYPEPRSADREGIDDLQGSAVEPERVLDERHVEERDFAWCPHCANMIPRGTTVCPNCGRAINGMR
jgi:hypothetical protein